LATKSSNTNIEGVIKSGLKQSEVSKIRQNFSTKHILKLKKISIKLNNYRMYNTVVSSKKIPHIRFNFISKLKKNKLTYFLKKNKKIRIR
jgi:hypothetical protein